MKTEGIPQLLNYNDLETYYGLKKSTITKLVMTGDFTNVVKVGNKNFFRIADVEAWIDSRTITISKD